MVGRHPHLTDFYEENVVGTLTDGSNADSLHDHAHDTITAGTIADHSDAEELNFIPGIADDTLNGSSEGQAYSVQVGSSTQVGNRIFFSLRVSISDLGTLNTGQSARVVGLPKTSLSTSNSNSAVSVGPSSSFGLPNASESLTGQVVPNAAYIALHTWDGAGGTTALLISELTVDANIIISGFYEIP